MSWLDDHYAKLKIQKDRGQQVLGEGKQIRMPDGRIFKRTVLSRAGERIDQAAPDLSENDSHEPE